MQPAQAIEGVGDEVWPFVATLTVGFATLAYCHFKPRQAGELHAEATALLFDHPAAFAGLGPAGQHPTPPHTRRTPPAEGECPICLERFLSGVETNCGHWFCAGCVMQYWRTSTQGSVGDMVKCPYCRTEVSIFFVADGDEAGGDEGGAAGARAGGGGAGAAAGTLQQIREYNQRFSGAPRSVLDHVWDTPILLRRMCQAVFSVQTLARLFTLRWLFHVLAVTGASVGGVLYLIFPYDLVPEAALGFVGYVDDAVVMLSSWVIVGMIYRNWVVNAAIP